MKVKHTRNRLSNYDVIVELFQGKREEEQLNENQMQYLRAVRMTYGMMLDVRSKLYIVGSLIRMFDIHQATAYRIIKDTEKLFGEISKVDKEISRQVAVEMAKTAYNKAKLRDDVKGMIGATKAYIEATGLKLEDADMPDLEKLQPSLVITVLPEGMEDDIQRMLQSGSVNLNRIPAETIDYEELPGGTDQEGDQQAARAGE